VNTNERDVRSALIHLPRSPSAALARRDEADLVSECDQRGAVATFELSQHVGDVVACRFPLALVRLLRETASGEGGADVKYMLLFCGTVEGQRAYDGLTPEELETRLGQVGRWFGEHADKITEGNQLQPPQTATTVHLDRDASPLVADGPFLEGNEVIGGYAIVDVSELDDALVMARAWPGGGSIEVRPVVSR
jgi:hypothetical protein